MNLKSLNRIFSSFSFMSESKLRRLLFLLYTDLFIYIKTYNIYVWRSLYTSKKLIDVCRAIMNVILQKQHVYACLSKSLCSENILGVWAIVYISQISLVCEPIFSLKSTTDVWTDLYISKYHTCAGWSLHFKTLCVRTDLYISKTLLICRPILNCTFQKYHTCRLIFAFQYFISERADLYISKMSLVSRPIFTCLEHY